MLTRLPDHGRYGYSPIHKRPDYSWPDGKRLAFHFATNIEIFAFGQGLGHAPAAVTPPPDHRGHAWRDYGLRVGCWNVFDMLDELQLPANHLVNSLMYNYAPDIMDRIRARGDEIIGHGRSNAERQGIMWEEDEAALIREVNDTFRRHEGKAPRAWMSPWMSHSTTTPDLLREAADRQRLSQEGSFPREESSLITSRVAQQREISFPAAYWTEAEALARAEKWRAVLETGPRMVRVLTDRFLGQIEIGQIGRVTYPGFGVDEGFVGVVVGWRESLTARRVEITLWGAG